MVPADFIGHIMASSRPELPVLNATASGFTNPVLLTFGGTVTPSGSAHIADGTRFVVQIQAGGAVGVATFKTSIDGGATYGATQTTAASMVDATSGITLAFVGTLTALGTATFRSAFTPLAQWNDPAGNARSAVDHNGYYNSRNLLYKEYWPNPTGVVGSVSAPVVPIPVAPSWVFDISVPGTGATYQLGLDASSLFPFSSASVLPSTGATADAWLGQYACMIFPHSGVTLAFNWYGKINSVGVTNCTQYAGMGGGNQPSRNRWVSVVNAFTDGVSFSRASGQANWQCNAMAATVTTTVDSGIAATTNTTRFGIELVGSAAPTGPCARFFINGALAATITTNLPTTALKFTFGQKIAASPSVTDNTQFVGPLFISANYELSVPVL